MLESARVPAYLRSAFELAEMIMQARFSAVELRPDKGTVHIGGDRYVLVRSESFYIATYDALSESFGETIASEMLYTIARAIGAIDSRSWNSKLGLSGGIARLASGPVHFAHAGWAFVEIYAGSRPAKDESYVLHFGHPNTFETDALKARGRASTGCACYFSAGYSAGWCSEAFDLHLHTREIQCVARGDARCEFIMAPPHRIEAALDEIRAQAEREQQRQRESPDPAASP